MRPLYVSQPVLSEVSMTQEPGHSLRSRTPYLPIHKRPTPAAARRRARRGVDHRQCRELEPDRSDAAHGAAAADGPAAAARRAELGVARVRHARGLLALPRGAGRAQAQGDVRRQRHGLRALSRGLPGGARRRLGIHGPRLHAAADAPGRRPARRRSATPSRRSRTSPASRRAAGRARASPRPTRRSTCWPRRASSTSPTGCSTSSRCRSRRAPARSSRCPTRSRSTTS